VADLSESWKDRPPVQWMVQAYLGIKPQGKAEDDAEFDSLVAAMNPQA
jgi:hypothetical protein